MTHGRPLPPCRRPRRAGWLRSQLFLAPLPPQFAQGTVCTAAGGGPAQTARRHTPGARGFGHYPPGDQAPMGRTPTGGTDHTVPTQRAARLARAFTRSRAAEPPGLRERKS